MTHTKVYQKKTLYVLRSKLTQRQGRLSSLKNITRTNTSRDRQGNVLNVWTTFIEMTRTEKQNNTQGTICRQSAGNFPRWQCHGPEFTSHRRVRRVADRKNTGDTTGDVRQTVIQVLRLPECQQVPWQTVRVHSGARWRVTALDSVFDITSCKYLEELEQVPRKKPWWPLRPAWFFSSKSKLCFL